METILPKSKTPVMARTVEEKTLLVKSVPNVSHKNLLRFARGFVKTLPIQIFNIMVVNKSNTSVTFPKDMKLAQLTKEPSTIVPVRNVSGGDFIDALLIHNGRLTMEDEFAQHHHVSMVDKNKQKTVW